MAEQLLTLPLDAGEVPARVDRHAQAAARLRLAVPGLRGDARAARRIEQMLRGLAGVEEVRADSRSGRVLLRYRKESGIPAAVNRLPPNGERRKERRWPSLSMLRRTVAGQREPQFEAPWHALPIEAVLARLGCDRQGLDAAAAAARLLAYGDNATERAGPRSRLRILESQLANLPTGLLLGSSSLSLLLGDVVDAAAIVAVVVLNASIGYRVERKNEELLASWEVLEAGQAQVVRGGHVRSVPATQVVPGDVILIAAGDILPADARVIESHRLACDEAPLTGESEAQEKGEAAVPEDAPLAERSSMVWAGTLVATGHGRAVVTATGPAREIARVERLVEEKRAPRAPLARRLDELGNRVSVGALGAAVVTAVAKVAHGRPLAEVVRGAVALGVAAIPEGLPLVSTAALVRSMQRMRAAGMVVRRLTSAEALGGVTVICADKTGTLTRNRMRLEVLDLGAGPLDLTSLRFSGEAARPEAVLSEPRALALAAALLNSDVEVQGRGGTMEIVGSSTERALVAAAHAAGLDGAALRRGFPRRRLWERNVHTRYVVSTHDAPGGSAVAFVKGAPEQVLGLCDRDLAGPLDELGRARALARNEAMAADGLRVLALAWRRIDSTSEVPRDGYRLLGLVGLRDPLRPEAADAVAAAKRAGIRTVVLTGDQRRTAEAVARAVGLRGEALDGTEAGWLLGTTEAREGGRPPHLGHIDGRLAARLRGLAVLARVAPVDKVQVVEALRQAGEIVAMVGDGINDAPALKAADVGVAVGVRSSDLARQVADVVMSREDLRSILAAVGEGRIVQDNLRRSIRYLFATNLSELALVLGAALVGARDPLAPLQLLWINLLTDSLPALALALEPGRPEVLDRPPVDPTAPLLPRRALGRVARDGLLLAAGGAFGLALGGPPLAFSLLAGLQLGYTALCRAPGGTSDPRFFQLLGTAAGLQLPALLLPPLRSLLQLGAASPLPSLLGFSAGLLAPAAVGPLLGRDVIEWRRPERVGARIPENPNGVRPMPARGMR